MYYLVTVGYETERLDRQGNPRIEKLKYPVEAESVEEASERIARFNSDSMRTYEVLEIKKLPIDCVIDSKNRPEIYKSNF